MSSIRHSVSSCLSLVWHSEPPSYHDRAFIAIFSTFRAIFLAFGAVNLVWAFRVSSLVFSVISFFSLAFRAMSSVRYSESSCFSSDRRLDPLYLFQFGVQSRIFISTFRVIVYFSLTFKFVFLVWHLKPFFNLAFRATSLVWHSKSLFASNLAFRATMFLQLGIQCQHLSLVLMFRVSVHTHSGI